MKNRLKDTLLIVDDEQTNLIALTRMLSDDYELLLAKSGEHALTIAEKAQPDLILLDVMMPGMSGFDVIAAIQEVEAMAQVPVIFITGLDSVEDEERGFLLGAVDYITKPFKPVIVKARIATHLRIVHQARLTQKLGMQDALTEIPNRRNFDIQMPREWNRAMRNQSPLSFLMLDIDHFKNYNDTYGHPQGDRMLKAVAKAILRATRRPADLAARIGGEEFGLLLPDTDLAGALNVAENVRAAVEGMTVADPTGESTCVTVSIGANCTIPSEAQSMEVFLEKADQKLYAAKEQGRNCVVS